jgi:hypothetical protein
MSKTFAGAAGNGLVANEIRHGSRAALLLHGGGQTRHAWARTAHRLAKAGWRVVAIDQRGHGDSRWMADGAYGFPDYAADAVAVAQRIAERGARAAATTRGCGVPRRATTSRWNIAKRAAQPCRRTVKANDRGAAYGSDERTMDSLPAEVVGFACR